MKERKLIDRTELVRKHPALGKKRYRLDWLVRERKIPCVKIGRRVYFDEAEIDGWLESQRIPVFRS